MKEADIKQRNLEYAVNKKWYKKTINAGTVREGTGMELLVHSSCSNLLPGPEVKAPPACQQTGQN